MIKEWIFFFFFFFARLFLNRNVTFATFVVEYYPAFFSRMEYKFKKKKYIYICKYRDGNKYVGQKSRDFRKNIYTYIKKKREREKNKN